MQLFGVYGGVIYIYIKDSPRFDLQQTVVLKTQRFRLMRSLHIFISILEEKKTTTYGLVWPQAVLELKNTKDQAEAAQIKADSQVWPGRCWFT